MAGEASLRQKVGPGEYAVVLHIPVEDTIRELPGSINLRANSHISGELFREVPVSVSQQNGSAMMAFPQSYVYPNVSGELSTGHQVWLFGVALTTYAPNRSHIYASYALVGSQRLIYARSPQDIGDSFTGVRFQVTHLDRLLDFAPLVKVESPDFKSDEPLRWSAEERGSRYCEWVDASGNELSVGFDGRARSADPYVFQLRYTPVIDLTFSEPIPIDTVMKTWLEPMAGAATVAAGGASEVTYAEIIQGRQRYQWFGRTIGQAPYSAQPWTNKDVRPMVEFGNDSNDLLAVVTAWADRVAQRSPIFETYTALAGVSGEHPRNRYLLLTQAIEGHYGHVKESEYKLRQEEHTRKRREHMAIVKSLGIERETKKFLDQHVMRRVNPTFNDAISWAFGEVPTSIGERILRSDLVEEVAPSEPSTGQRADALRIIRNDLAHGLRGYDPDLLHDVVQDLELVVRSLVLQSLELRNVRFPD